MNTLTKITLAPAVARAISAEPTPLEVRARAGAEMASLAEDMRIGEIRMNAGLALHRLGQKHPEGSEERVALQSAANTMTGTLNGVDMVVAAADAIRGSLRGCAALAAIKIVIDAHLKIKVR